LKPQGEVLFQHLLLLLGSVALLTCFTSLTIAQQARVEIKVPGDSPGRVIVEGTWAPATTWSFRDSYAGVLNLGARISGFTLLDDSGKEVANRTLAPGQFRSEMPAKKFRYEVNLIPPQRSADAARVSWLNAERGLLMLRDLLPARGAAEQGAERLTVRISLPAGWVGHTDEAENVRGEFDIADADLAVFAVGQNLRISTISASGLTMSCVLAGDWAFKDAEAADLAARVLKAHRDMFGASPTRRATLILFPFPQSGATDSWTAETRGFSVTLLTGKLPSKVAALAQLSSPLTHEFLHFWVPNGLNLTGDYDWFYEGFTVYQAAQMAVRLDLLTFQEFLNALGRAYDGYALSLDRDRWSVVESSKRRWTVGNSAVYSKSMLIAFLYDLKLRSLSQNKHSLDDVYRGVFRDYRYEEKSSRAGTRPGQGSDGSEAVLKALGSYPGMQDFGGSFIVNPASINLAERLAPFGLRVETFGLRTRINVSESLTRQQRDLLHDLGYNDYVRSPRQRKSS
jgi:predicted metalloprotease with PDZ domain